MRQYQVDLKLQELLTDDNNKKMDSVIIVAGDLNKILPFTTEKDHNRCPMCCKAMRAIFNANIDKIIPETSSGESSTFAIDYKLPRKITVI